jgi:uncharacterized protein YaaQ
MKLLTVILQSEDAPSVLEALIQRGFRATRISTAGGFLQKTNATLLLGVDDDRVEEALEILRGNSQTRTQMFYPSPILDLGAPIFVEPFEVEVGGATIFILDVEEFVRL